MSERESDQEYRIRTFRCSRCNHWGSVPYTPEVPCPGNGPDGRMCYCTDTAACREMTLTEFQDFYDL